MMVGKMAIGNARSQLVEHIILPKGGNVLGAKDLGYITCHHLTMAPTMAVTEAEKEITADFMANIHRYHHHTHTIPTPTQSTHHQVNI